MDLEQTSLTSRVCNGDGKLILSTEHASLLEQINATLTSNSMVSRWRRISIVVC